MKERDEDIIVIEKILRGDTRSFEVLLKKYQDYVARILAPKVPHQNIPEVTHDVFLRAYRSLSGYSGKEPFVHWLKTIAVRACHDFWRARYRNREVPMSTLSEVTQEWLEGHQMSGNALFSIDEANRVEIRQLLDWALQKLSSDDRMIVLLLYFEGHSVQETARLLGYSQANVKIRSFRSRRKLRKILGSLVS